MFKNKLLFLFIFCLGMLSFSAAMTAAADSGIKISVDTGFAGKVKSIKGFPLKLTIENAGGDFHGDLLLNFNASYNSSGAKAVKVDLPKGSKKTYLISMPGISEDFMNNQNPNQKSIFLYKGSWIDGKEVDFVGNDTFKPRFVDQASIFIGVLSENPDRLKELKLFPGMQTEVQALNEGMIPDDGSGLGSLDYIAVDEYGLSKLKKNQQKAIMDWIEKGGVLIAGASPNAVQSYGELYQLLPMKLETEIAVNSSFLKAGQDVIPFKEIPVFSGSVDQNAIIDIKSGDTPVVIHKKHGLGEIWQTAFSLGDEPLSSWKEYGKWFAGNLLQSQSVNMQSYKGSPSIIEMLVSDFAEVNEFFPTTHFTLGQISLMLFVYLLIVAPILYFLLRKLDKREHAWWMITGLAFVSSVGIFSIGAKDRIAKPQLNQMGAYAAGNGGLNGYSAVSFLSNTGGNYQLTISEGNFDHVPASLRGANLMNGKGNAVLERNGVTFPNVEYWSIRSLIGNASKDNVGRFETNLSYKNKKLTGTINNQFPYDFEEVYVWTGKNKVSLGAMKKGETLTVNESLNQDFLTSPYSPGNSYRIPNNSQDIEKFKKEKLEFSAIEYLYNLTDQNNKPILYGYTKDSIIKAKILNRNERVSNTNLIYQPLDVDSVLSGAFTLQKDNLSAHLEVVSGSIMYEEPGHSDQKQLDDGEYNYFLELPKPLQTDKATFQELEINWYKGNSPVTYSIYNNKTKEFSALTSPTTTIKENVDEFINHDGAIIIKLQKSGRGDPMVRMPSLSLKGGMNP